MQSGICILRPVLTVCHPWGPPARCQSCWGEGRGAEPHAHPCRDAARSLPCALICALALHGWLEVQAEVADTAQASQDAAAAMLRHVANPPGPCGPGGPGRSRQELARRARVSGAAAAVEARVPWRAYPDTAGHELPKEVEGPLRSALNAAAERAAATEAHVQQLVSTVEQSLAKDGMECSREAAECVAALTRLLHATSDATEMPSEASVKQLVSAPPHALPCCMKRAGECMVRLHASSH